MTERRKLSDILRDKGALAKVWESTQAAAGTGPLPRGEYIAFVLDGVLDTSRHGTPEYRLTFQVTEGDHAGRRFWHHLYLTPDAMPLTKCYLSRLGITSLEMLDLPLPPGIKCKVKLSLRVGDNGSEYNRVETFDVVGVEPPAPDPFAPGAAPTPTDNGHAEELFPFGANAHPTTPPKGGR